MNYVQPTIKELFASTYNKKLLDIQSTHLLNNSLAKRSIKEGFEGIPLSIPEPETMENEVIKNKIAKSLLGTYVKNNWKVMLICLITGGVFIYAGIKKAQYNKKLKNKK